MTINNEAREACRKRLQARKQSLLSVRQTGEEAANVVELDQTRQGRISRMDAMQSQAMSVETNRRRKIELARIDSALERLDTGSYGDCVRCREEIDPRRLELDPAALLCINCAR